QNAGVDASSSTDQRETKEVEVQTDVPELYISHTKVIMPHDYTMPPYGMEVVMTNHSSKTEEGLCKIITITRNDCAIS
ncbi:MAG: hypothetical protein ACEY3F_08250, partial [Wolbachia sp.]